MPSHARQISATASHCASTSGIAETLLQDLVRVVRDPGVRLGQVRGDVVDVATDPAIEGLGGDQAVLAGGDPVCQ